MAVEPTAEKPNRIGVISMAVAAFALFVTVIHWAAGPINPSEPVEETIADTAVKIKEAARRALSNTPAPEPQQPAFEFDVDRAVDVVALLLAGLAMGIGLFALAKREQQAPAFVGFSLGGAVLLMAWLQWIALIIAGAIILAAIISNLGEILSF